MKPTLACISTYFPMPWLGEGIVLLLTIPLKYFIQHISTLQVSWHWNTQNIALLRKLFGSESQKFMRHQFDRHSSHLGPASLRCNPLRASRASSQ